MFCPKCANQSADDLKFCTVCGTNLASVSLALQDPKTLTTEREWKRPSDIGKAIISAKLAAIAKRGSETHAERSLKLMQAGVIVGCVGIGVTIFLFMLFTALASGETGDPQGQAVLLALRAVGLVPFFVGVGLYLGGWLFRSKSISTDQPGQLPRQQPLSTQGLLSEQKNETFSPSITEHTTRHLYEQPVRSAHDTKEVN